MCCVRTPKDGCVNEPILNYNAEKSVSEQTNKSEIFRIAFDCSLPELCGQLVSWLDVGNENLYYFFFFRSD